MCRGYISPPNQNQVLQPGGDGQPRYPPQPGYLPLVHPQGGDPQGGYPPPTEQGFQAAYGGAAGYGEPGYAVPGVGGLGEDGEVKAFDFSIEQFIRRSFFRKVYSVLMVQSMVTMTFIAVFLFHMPTKTWVRSVGMVIFWIAFVLEIVCLVAMAYCGNVRRKTPTNYLFLVIFTVAESFLLGVYSSIYDVSALMMAVGLTAAACLSLTLFAVQTKWDFTMLSGMLMVCGVVLVLFGLIAIFIPKNDILTLVYASLGASLFTFYLIYDTQQMMSGRHKYTITQEEYIFATLTIYLDLIHIYLRICCACDDDEDED